MVVPVCPTCVCSFWRHSMSNRGYLLRKKQMWAVPHLQYPSSLLHPSTHLPSPNASIPTIYSSINNNTIYWLLLCAENYAKHLTVSSWLTFTTLWGTSQMKKLRHRTLNNFLKVKMITSDKAEILSRQSETKVHIPNK